MSNETEEIMAFVKWLNELDDVLRGRKADPELLSKGTTHIHARPLILISIFLGVTYGLFMGLYAVLTRTPPCFAQLAASAVKVPLLFLLTLFVTFPSLYVFSALLGVQLKPKDILRLILVPIAVNLAVLASLGPITGFFTLNTTSYHFMKLLNVFFFALSGMIGLGVLLRMLSRLEGTRPAPNHAKKEPSEESTSKAPDESRQKMLPSPLPKDSVRARKTFRVWLLLYALVGAQMGWILRPFIGKPDLPFRLFRAREANIFIDVLRSIGELLRI